VTSRRRRADTVIKVGGVPLTDEEALALVRRGPVPIPPAPAVSPSATPFTFHGEQKRAGRPPKPKDWQESVAGRRGLVIAELEVKPANARVHGRVHAANAHRKRAAPTRIYVDRVARLLLASGVVSRQLVRRVIDHAADDKARDAVRLTHPGHVRAILRELGHLP